MNGFLLDTNILSELRKAHRCDRGVREWFEQTKEDELYLSVLVLGEIRHGIERIRGRDQSSAVTLEKWLDNLSLQFADHLLPVDQKISDQWGRLGSKQPAPVIDALLAATALTHNLTVVSRDERGFRNTGVRVLNPFKKN